MKTICLNRVENALSESEMKQVKGGIDKLTLVPEDPPLEGGGGGSCSWFKCYCEEPISPILVGNQYPIVQAANIFEAVRGELRFPLIFVLLKNNCMRLNFLVFVFFIITGICNAYSQQSSIIFTSDKDYQFIIYKPVDDFYNQYYPTDTVDLHPGGKVVYTLNIDDWSVVKCVASQTKFAADIFVERGGIVQVHNTESSIQFGGNNAAANEFFYRTLFFRRGNFNSIIDSLFQTKNIDSINKIINNTRLLPQTAFLYEHFDSLFVKEDISEKCYHYCIKEVDYQIKNKMLFNFYYERNNYKPMTDTIKDYISLIGKTLQRDEKITSYTNGSGISQYHSFLFNQLGKSDKDSLIAGFSKETFGPYSRFLIPQGLTRLALFFDAMILQYQFGVNEFDRVAMYNYLKSKYPGSEAVRIIGKLVEDELIDTSLSKPVFLSSDSVTDFSDLKNIEDLQNRYIFVDLWASWCMPCRAEFSHNKRLNTLLATYQNIEKIYISIDENKENWESAIKSLKLSGYQMLASEKLVTFLKKEIYKNNAMSIPRYLLVDPQGNILNDNLARPSEMDKLKMQLDEYLKF